MLLAAGRQGSRFRSAVSPVPPVPPSEAGRRKSSGGYDRGWIEVGGQESFVQGGTERSVCLLAEAVLREMDRHQFSGAFTIVCRDACARERIAAYLDDVMLELSGVP